MLENLRQFLKYSKEIRIAAPLKSDCPDNLEDIVSLLRSLSEDAKAATTGGGDLLPLTKDVITTIWRLQRRLTTAGESPDVISRALRDLQSISDSLRQAGFETKDQTGGKYDTGMALKVIAFQPIPGLSQEQIIETIKPTIYYDGKIAQIGEVIVGVPEKDHRSINQGE
jgi:hypothetical protein